MKNKILIIILLLIVVITFFYINGRKNNISVDSKDSPKTVETKPADNIEVIHFHATNQCYSCITVGKLAKKTIEEKFTKENKSGKIIFKSINIDLAQNTYLVNKYQVRGSSLFINSITDNKHFFKEDVTVWRLLNNEPQFIDYLEKEIKKLL